MLCHVYRCTRRADTYLYLARRDDFACVPEALRAPLGPLEFAFQFELTAERKLAREEAGVVLGNLAARGFHLQFPPDFVMPHAGD